MRRGIHRLAAAFGMGTMAMFVSGCGSTEVTVEKVAPVEIPKEVKAEDQPKDSRPPAGSSSGINYNPGGLNPGSPSR